MPLRLWRGALCLAAALGLVACGSVQVEDYADREPVLDVEQFFRGDLMAYGVVKDRGGRVIRSFEATIEATWEDGTGTLDENFVFDDGERQRRVWVLQRQSGGRYSATAGDVTGTAVLQQAGNSMFLEYVLQVPYRGDVIEVTVDDRMYLVAPDVLLNESTLYKFGLRVGSLLLVITRDS
jgi:hypothetical protein